MKRSIRFPVVLHWLLKSPFAAAAPPFPFNLTPRHHKQQILSRAGQFSCSGNQFSTWPKLLNSLIRPGVRQCVEEFENTADERVWFRFQSVAALLLFTLISVCLQAPLSPTAWAYSSWHQLDVTKCLHVHTFTSDLVLSGHARLQTDVIFKVELAWRIGLFSRGSSIQQAHPTSTQTDRAVQLWIIMVSRILLSFSAFVSALRNQFQTADPKKRNTLWSVAAPSVASSVYVCNESHPQTVCLFSRCAVASYDTLKGSAADIRTLNAYFPLKGPIHAAR